MINVLGSVEEHCSGCGLCESICPVNAINIRERDGFFRPTQVSKCIECGRCIKYCPGFDKDKVSGKYKEFEYVLYGHSKNEKVRKDAASGGVTSELLYYMLKERIVDYVITADNYEYDRDGKYAIIETENAEMIFNKSGSNYCPINMGRALKEIQSRDGKCAIVCLPCLALGISKLRKNEAIFHDKIAYVISLLCNHTPSYEATDYLIKKYNAPLPKLVKYRGNGWFGNLRMYDRAENGTEIFSVPFSEYFGTKYSENFWQKACVDCRDHFGMNADICMGDADFVKYRDRNKENNGETVCFFNNLEMLTILKEMEQKNIIYLNNDVKNEELKLIYGPLEETDRASTENLKKGYKRILVEEKREKIVENIKRTRHRFIGRLRKLIGRGSFRDYWSR